MGGLQVQVKLFTGLAGYCGSKPSSERSSISTVSVGAGEVVRRDVGASRGGDGGRGSSGAGGLKRGNEGPAGAPLGGGGGRMCS